MTMEGIAIDSDLVERAATYYNSLGQTKPMGDSAPSASLPHYFLLRTFRAENDLLVIFNTKRCHYQCHFCMLPAKSSRAFIDGGSIVSQFGFVLEELKHALSIVDRITLSNEGSVLDEATFPVDALVGVAKAANELRRVRRLVLETRLEFVRSDVLSQLTRVAPRASLDILTGFESVDARIRNEVLGKREPLSTFLSGLDRVAEARADLTAYVLFKPTPEMSDDDATPECERSIDFLVEECRRRDVALTVRINPMYLASGSRWASTAASEPRYMPPKLTDVMKVAERKRKQGVPIYIGLSTEGLDEGRGNYTYREDYSRDLIRSVKLFNDGKLDSFIERA